MPTSSDLPGRAVPAPVPAQPGHRSARDESASLDADAVSAFLHAPIGVAVCTPDGVVTRVNGAVTRLLGYAEEELLGRDLFRLVQPELVAGAIAACAALRQRPEETVVHETRFRSRDGRSIDVRVTTSAVRATAAAPAHAIMHLEDVSQREDLRRQLEHQASHDALTGLANRAAFLEQLQRALPRGERHGEPVTVLYLDLNGFKQVNDRFGHAAGDEVLRGFAAHLRGLLRPEDTAARLGGDEFAVLCEGTSPEQAAVVARRLADGFRSTGAGPDVLEVGVAVGVATSPDADGTRPGTEDLLHAADAAMYAAKSRPSR
ncbi:GGDEF domain-containing protein [Kineococcus sp. SYSU DK006]|uniref:GGDEF domain-containing protein n=1 Tax=Kineococcus sp. SYSU DK006 TaxID=3383127 RepID=UPI003D7C50E1